MKKLRRRIKNSDKLFYSEYKYCFRCHLPHANSINKNFNPEHIRRIMGLRLNLYKRENTSDKKFPNDATVKDLLKAQEKIELFDIDKKESRLVPLTDPTAGDKASEAIGRYMGAVYKKMGKSADYHIEKGTVKLPKKINFKHFNKKYTIEKLDDVPLRDTNRRKIDPD